jgi:NAD(P)H-hydrate epimerase
VVAARHLRERGHPVTVLVLGQADKLSPDARAQLAIADALGLTVRWASGDAAHPEVADLLPKHAVIVDGLFGMGLDREVEGWRRGLLELVEASPHAVAAVDIPSGVDADTGQVLGEALSADITVTFQYPKLGQLLHPGRARCGALRVVDIGIPGSRLPAVAGEVAGLMELDTLQAALPMRAPDAHKGSFGHLLVVAGAPDRPGSALLAARAALRAGAGLVTVGSDEETVARLAPALSEVMGLSIGSGRVEPRLLKHAAKRKTAIALGPSLEPDEATRALLQDVLSELRLPAVLDAGALTALGEDVAWLAGRPGPTVLTPHPGEAGRLLGLDVPAVQADRVTAARRLAERAGAYTVLKGATTVVAEPGGEIILSSRGGPALATGGTGDVLMGIVGSLLAQGVEPGLAARAAVELHGLAGDRAAEQLGARAVMASDVVRFLAGPIPGVDEPRG